MMDFSVARTLAIVFGTWPFLVLRLAVYFAITLVYVLGTGIGAGVGYGIGLTQDDPSVFAFWGAFGTIGVISGVLYWAREYVLYLVKAGHIAVMVEALDGAALPGGTAQIAHATATVKERFAESSVLFAVDQLVKGVLGVITGTLHAIAAFLPIQALQSLVGIFNAVLRLSITYVDEIILAHAIRTRSENPWESARTALVLYAQNYWSFAKNAIFLAIIMWALTLLVFVFVFAPVAGLLALFVAGESWVIAAIVALVFAVSLKAALMEPFAIAALMQVYFKVTSGQTPDPEWEARLEGASNKFVEMKDRALAWARGRGAPQP